MALIGGALPALLFLANAYAPGAFRLLLYGMVLLVGTLVGLEIPLVMRILKRQRGAQGPGVAGAHLRLPGRAGGVAGVPAAAGAAPGAGAHGAAVRPDERGGGAVGGVAVSA